jgi:hypothetical protein
VIALEIIVSGESDFLAAGHLDRLAVLRLAKDVCSSISSSTGERKEVRGKMSDGRALRKPVRISGPLVSRRTAHMRPVFCCALCSASSVSCEEREERRQLRELAGREVLT